MTKPKTVLQPRRRNRLNRECPQGICAVEYLSNGITYIRFKISVYDANTGKFKIKLLHCGRPDDLDGFYKTLDKAVAIRQESLSHSVRQGHLPTPK